MLMGCGGYEESPTKAVRSGDARMTEGKWAELYRLGINAIKLRCQSVMHENKYFGKL